MAEPKKRGDSYRMEIMVNGQKRSKSFPTKKECREWEAEMRTIARAEPNSPLLRDRMRLSDAVDRYLKSVTPGKRNAAQWEAARFNLLLSKFSGYMDDLTKNEVSLWRDELLSEVSGSTVNRYFNLYSNLFTTAMKEWEVVSVNPFASVKRPNENPPRVGNIWRWRDIRRVLRAGQRAGGKTEQVTVAFHISLRTSLRLQEALIATKGYDNKRMTIELPSSKNSRVREFVATVAKGRRVLRRYAKVKFTVDANEASTLFSKLHDQLLIKGLQYRDSRATALTSMAKIPGMNAITLGKIARHKDLRLLESTYFRDTPEEISRRF